VPFRIAKTFRIESGHQLTKHRGACRFPHGHSRIVEIVLTADALDANDVACDFKAIKRAAAPVVERYDHAFAIKTADVQFPSLRSAFGERVIAFPNIDPTTEVLAREIFRAVRERLAAAVSDPEFPVGRGVRLERVRVSETASNWAEYWE